MVEAVKAIALKKEVTYKTDAVPTLAANAVPTRNFRAKPVEGDRLQYNYDRGTWGATSGKFTNERQSLSFEMLLASSGAAGTAPPWMAILEGCGMAPAVLTAATKAEQSFAKPTDGQGSLSTRHWVGDQLRKGVGARGSWSLTLTAGDVPVCAVELMALIPAAAPFSVAAPAGADFTAWKEPIEVNSDNTAITLDGYAVTLQSMKITSGVNVALRNMVGARYVNRGPHSVSVEMVIEAPSIAAKDYIASLRSGALLPIVVTHGVGAGNVLGIDVPRFQLGDIAESEDAGKLMWTLTGDAVISAAGGDELLLTAK